MSVPLDDRGLLLGDGLFETVLWKGDSLVLGPGHAARMIRGAGVIGLPAPDPADILTIAESAAREGGFAGQRAAVRITLTAGSGGRGLDRPASIVPRLFATAAPSAPPPGPARLAVATVRRNAGSPASRLKSLAYLDNVLAREQARAAGADEAILLNTEGQLACAAVANLFWIAADAVFTPPLEAGCLDGIMRAELFRAAPALGLAVHEALAGPEALASADALFLTNSLTGVRAARLVGGHDGSDHRMIAGLQAALAGVS